MPYVHANISFQVTVFYVIRALLALFTAACEWYLYNAVQRVGGDRVASWFILLSMTSAGMYIAAAGVSHIVISCITLLIPSQRSCQVPLPCACLCWQPGPGYKGVTLFAVTSHCIAHPHVISDRCAVRGYLDHSWLAVQRRFGVPTFTLFNSKHNVIFQSAHLH